MKKVSLFFIVIFLFSINSFTQVFEEGDFVVDAQIGFPNISYVKTQINSLSHLSLSPNSSNVKNKSIGQFIINSEFFITETVGMNISFNYGYYYDYYEREESIYDGNTNTTITNVYFYEKQTHRFRLYIGPHFHLTRTEKLDTYFGVKAGLKQSKIIVNNNDPNNIIFNEFEELNLIPVGLRVCYGLRYLVGERLLLNTEFGLGGPVVSVGISYKITKNTY